MGSHTPGPWTIEPEDDDGNLYENGVRIDSPEGPVAFDVIDCSAPLISAAPELLQALRGLLSWTECECVRLAGDTPEADDPPMCDHCVAKLIAARAEGR